jgi:glycosyltransferase involved in cell wall biosynthesis
MNILQLAPYFPPYAGGQEKYVHLLSRELVRNGHQVTVLTANYPPAAGHEWIDGIAVHRKDCYARPLRNPISPGLFFPGIDLDAFDLIHAHNEHSSAAMAAVWLKSRAHKPLVLTCHGQLVFGQRFADGVRRLYWNTVGRSILTRAERITVATDSERRRLVSEAKLDAGRVKVVPVGIDFAAWEALSGKAEAIPFLDEATLKGRRVLLVATQLIRRKGIQFLLQALPAVLKVHPDVLCVIAGTGDYAAELRSMVAQNDLGAAVRFTGLLTSGQLASLYQQAHLFILPSLGEGQPTCVMEAWAYACPVVATRIEGVTDYFDGIAYLAEPADPASLAGEILRALNDPAAAQQLGRKGRALVREQFAWEKVAARMLRVYESCLGAGT